MDIYLMLFDLFLLLTCSWNLILSIYASLFTVLETWFWHHLGKWLSALYTKSIFALTQQDWDLGLVEEANTNFGPQVIKKSMCIKLV